MHRALDIRRKFPDAERSRLDLPGCHLIDRHQQFRDALAAPCRGGNDRNAEFVGQLGHVDTDALTPGLVHQIEADDHSIGDLEHLDHQVEVALETGRIDHDDRDVGTPKEEEVAGYFFVGAAGLQ